MLPGVTTVWTGRFKNSLTDWDRRAMMSMRISRMISAAIGWTYLEGWEPALATSRRSPAAARNTPSAI